MRQLILIFVLLLASAAAFGQMAFPDSVLGVRSGAYSARSLSLGHTYLTNENGPSCVMGNPAGLADQDKRWRFAFSGNLARNEEVRKYPIFDAFNGVLVYNNYALNDHLYSKADGGIAFKVPTDLVQSLVLSLSSYSAYSFDYTYREEVRDRSSEGGIMDRQLGFNRLDISGDLRTISLGAASKMFGPVALGFAFNTLAGNWTYTKSVSYTGDYISTDSNMVQRVRYSNSGAPGEINFGATYDVSARLKVGARALLPTGEYKFSRDGSFTHYSADSAGPITENYAGDITETYPKRLSLGVQYRPQSEFRPVLMLEGEVYTYHDTDPAFDNTFEIRAGVEQQVVPGAPIRFGYVYSTSPSDQERAASLFTAGIGFAVQKLNCDLGVELGTFSYTSPDLFPQHLYGVADRINNDRVDTNIFRGIVTLTYDL
jgi:hypothetical protein